MPQSPERVPYSVETMGIAVQVAPRSCMLSDRRGGFMVASLVPGNAPRIQWSIGGREIFHELNFEGGNPQQALVMDSASIFPHELRIAFQNGFRATLLPLERAGEQHALAVVVQAPTAAASILHILPSADFSSTDPLDGLQSTWKTRNGLVLGLSAEESDGATIYILTCGNGEDPRPVAARIGEERRMRAARMDSLLNRTFYRSGDKRMDLALAWIKLSLDALAVTGQDTVFANAVPWDGAFSVRDNVQSAAGLSLALGDPRMTVAVLRSASRWQDTRPASQTSGRIAARVQNGIPSYVAADVTPVYVRMLYDHIATSGDTALLSELYRGVALSIDRALSGHVDKSNLLVHGDGETWIPATRGNRAAEVEVFWYYQQLIGSFMAMYQGDTTRAQRWQEGAEKTLQGFASVFIDTTTGIICDHISSDGKPSTEIRPNPLLCLDVIGPEAVKQATIEKILGAVAFPHGVATLDPAAVPAKGDGHVETWLHGPLVYSLTRYDRQDLSYRITEEMARRVMETDMAGTIPAGYEAYLRAGEPSPRVVGSQASLLGMAEYIRTMYQDYLGVRYDVMNNVLTLQPKLPDSFTRADFTIYGAGHPFHVVYDRGEELSRIIVTAPDIPRAVRLSFLWMMPNGDGWRGSIMVPPAARMTLALGKDDVLAYLGDSKVPLEGITHLVRFSMREEVPGFHLANAPILP